MKVLNLDKNKTTGPLEHGPVCCPELLMAKVKYCVKNEIYDRHFKTES